jgi:hypothetical protein
MLENGHSPKRRRGAHILVRQIGVNLVSVVVSVGAARTLCQILCPTSIENITAVPIIRDAALWLEHGRLDTANHYARANLETLRKALGQADPKLGTSKSPRWKREADLLAWLDSL